MNHLSSETSPYLLQHVHNPVDWHPWGTEALAKAKAENKPIIVSIGYSACHWCHVMERESFENQQVADVMNENFVCIKVDREERPDVDAVYMEAVQAMGVRGGWPLNVFLLPDGRPFYGGTYFPAQRWVNLCMGVREAFDTKLDEVTESATAFVADMNRKESEKYPLGAAFSLTKEDLKSAVEKMAYQFDKQKGGLDRAPKFPMPSIWLFLLRYAHHNKAKDVLEQSLFTLDAMAKGGIYDQLGGGFARYSTDANWLLPHFEKMLYDNGQLLSLYAEAIAITKETDPSRAKAYEAVVKQTVDWLEREMTSPEGSFYSALDADSEGEEGKFYVWSAEELNEILGVDAGRFAEIYGVAAEGNFHDEATGHETGLNILHRKNLDISAEQDFVDACFEKLMAVRGTRVRPGLDDKQLYSWNALMIKGLVDAYRVLRDEKMLRLATNCAEFLSQKMSAIFTNKDGARARGLFHSYKNGKASIMAYLEDYATGIQALTALYEATFNEKWLTEADELASYATANFFDPSEGLFFFTDSQAEALIARKKELFDNVVPASNSIMANALFRLGIMLDKADYQQVALKMLAKVSPIMKQQIDWLSNWGILALDVLNPMAEVIVVGSDAATVAHQLDGLYRPNKIMMGTTETSELGLLKGRKTTDDRTKIFVCYNKTCQLPTTEVATAWELLLE